VNKAQLIDALAEKLGDKQTAGAAVGGIVDVIIDAVRKGERVNITGFGVFEKRARAARTARNPRTGESVRVKKTNVPAFRAGTRFRDEVATGKSTRKPASGTVASARRPATASSSGAGAGKVTATSRSSGTSKASTAKASNDKASSSKASTSKATAAKAADANSNGAKSASAKTTAKAAKSSAAAKKSGAGSKKK
jgi:DNA-binding protein HU-beta